MPEPIVVSVTPARNRAWIIREHVAALRAQTRPPDGMIYVTGDNEDSTEGDVRRLQRDPATWSPEKRCYDPFLRVAQFRTGSPHWSRDIEGQKYTGDDHASLARVYNRCLDEALAITPEATHVWLLDSDVIPGPNVLELLLAADKDLVSAVVRNSPGALNFMAGHAGQTSLSGVKHPEPWRTGYEHIVVDAKPGPFVVSFLSACTLIRREVLEYDRDYLRVRFAAHPRSHDFPFCATAREAGFSLWIEPRARTAHYFHGPGKEPLR
jgi:GT2 family glycosyltransferase